MNLLEEVRQAIEEEDAKLPSEGAKIGYAIDHYGLTVEEIHECAVAAELTDVSVVEFIMSLERSGKDVKQSVEILKGYVKEAKEISDEEKKQNYLATSNLGMLKAFQKSVEDSKTRPMLKTGFKSIDQIFGGGMYDGLYVFGAIPSLGKTTLVMQIADRFAINNHHVMIASLEMSRFELMARSISRLTLSFIKEPGMDATKLKTSRQIMDGRLYKDYEHHDHLMIGLATERYAKYCGNIFVKEGVGDIGVNEIRQMVVEHIEQTGVTPILIVDYAQILAPYDVRATDKQNLDKATLELKRISRDFSTPVLVVSSFNRGGYNTKAGFASFKESGALEYGADVVIGLQMAGAGEEGFDSTEAKNRNPRQVEAVILKNRSGKTGDVVMFDYYPAYNAFFDRGIKQYV